MVKPYSTETQDWAHLKVRVKACLVESYDRLGTERGDAVVRSCFKRYTTGRVLMFFLPNSSPNRVEMRGFY